MHWAQVVLLAAAGGVTFVALAREGSGNVKHDCRTLSVPVTARLNACTAWHDQAGDDEARARALFYRAYARHEGKDLSGALSDYDETLRLRPDDAAALGGRAKVYLDRGERAAGRADLNRAVAVDPSFGPVLVMRASLREEDGDEAGALADYDAAVRGQPNYTTALSTRGQFHFEHGRYALALRDYDALLVMLPAWAPGYAYRGQMHAANGDPARAKADYDKALRLDPSLATLVAELQQRPEER